jgi:hypothetical protein
VGERREGRERGEERGRGEGRGGEGRGEGEKRGRGVKRGKIVIMRECIPANNMTKFGDSGKHETNVKTLNSNSIGDI